MLQLLSCGFVSVLSSSRFVVSDSPLPIILIICVTFHCLIILLVLGALIGNKEFASYILYLVFFFFFFFFDSVLRPFQDYFSS